MHKPLLIQYQDDQVIKRRQNSERTDMGTVHNLYLFSLKIVYIYSKLRMNLGRTQRSFYIHVFSKTNRENTSQTCTNIGPRTN